MTNGQVLRKSLGLDYLPNARIHRMVDGAYRVYFVYVDSSSPTTMITKNTLRTWLPKVGAYKYPFTNLGGSPPDHKVPTTPLIDLDDWNGNLAPADFVLIDLAGRFGKQSRFLFEGRVSDFPSHLYEDVTLEDLLNVGTSSFTAYFRSQRNKIMGPENRTAKLIQCDLQPDGSAIFSWLTEVTDDYPPGPSHRRPNPRAWS